VALRPLVEEVGEALGLPREGVISWTIDADETLEVEADREHLFRVLSNLTRNAVQAIESQGEAVKGEIGVKGRRDGGKVKLWVADDGPGVPPAARQHLFEAFKSSARKGGTGLGLAIAAELVGAHGGSLRLLDTAKGATFLIELPARATP
jgi:signal transduction histidine kinase